MVLLHILSAKVSKRTTSHALKIRKLQDEKQAQASPKPSKNATPAAKTKQAKVFGIPYSFCVLFINSATV